MLPKKYRFYNFDFKKFLDGNKRANEYFKIYKLDSENNISKFSVKVNCSKAIDRNKIKRRIFEIIKQNLKNINPGYYLILANCKCKNTSFKDLETKLLNILNKF